MKALKTIVATAVIVFALTTVATAGVRHLGDRDGDAQHPAYAQTAAQPAGGVTLSAEQFAALLKAAGDDGSKHRAKHATRTHEKAQKHSRTHALKPITTAPVRSTPTDSSRAPAARRITPRPPRTMADRRVAARTTAARTTAVARRRLRLRR